MACCSALRALPCKAEMAFVPATRGLSSFRFRCSYSGSEIFVAAGEDGLVTSHDGCSVMGNIDLACMQQRSKEWYELRSVRLTASSFGTALGLGFWKTGRVALWEEKLGLREPFAGNDATKWGVNAEAVAVQKYKEMTGNRVDYRSFQIYKEGDDAFCWLGASPDGLLERDAFGLSENGGILEVKCPHNKGRPEQGVVCSVVPYYYMPQVQGLMEILDRDWLDFFVWTMNESAIFRVDRDTDYWTLIFEVLRDFWWNNVIPAKQHLSCENTDLNAFKPSALHELTPVILKKSKQLAADSKLICQDDVRMLDSHRVALMTSMGLL
eukprot:c18271_g1_i1 orf=136-1107(+)